MKDAVALLADRLDLTDDERHERMPSGQRRLKSRVALARQRLRRAGLLEDSGFGRFRITELGRRVLKSKPSRVARKFLRQLAASDGPAADGGSSPPEEVLPDPAGAPEEALQDVTRSCGTVLPRSFSSKSCRRLRSSLNTSSWMCS